MRLFSLGSATTRQSLSRGLLSTAFATTVLPTQRSSSQRRRSGASDKATTITTTTSVAVNALLFSYLSFSYTGGRAAAYLSSKISSSSLRPFSIAAAAVGTTSRLPSTIATRRTRDNSYNNHIATTTAPAAATTRLYSTLLLNDNNNSDPKDDNNGGNGDDEDTSKWERLYEQGEIRLAGATFGNTFSSSSSSSSSTIQSQAKPIRVVSFDLDNTLWRTSAVIDCANDALAAFLEQKKIQQPIRTEVIMKDLFQNDKARYAPLLKEKAKGPVNLTQLRKDAITKILVDYNEYSDLDAQAMATEAFEVWAAARHDAIPFNMADQVVESLAKIRALLSSKNNDDGPLVKMGAITDGNSDPTLVESLLPYFDFCVNAEAVGVSKPDPRVYLEAMQQVVPLLSDGDCTMEEDQVGAWWVHIGDDFVKDIVAAKGMGMRTVWCRELIKSATPQKDGDIEKQYSSSSSSSQKRTVEDLVKDVSRMKVVRMQVGANDYLADTLTEEFADAIIDRFADLTNVLEDWHLQGVKAKAMRKDASVTLTDDNALQVIWEPKKDSPVPKSSSDAAVAESDGASNTVSSQTKRKFCVHCGERLPVEAKFCSSCGEKQPELIA